MAVVLDPHGVAWSVRRDWWPFWLAKARVNEIAVQIAGGDRSGSYSI